MTESSISETSFCLLFGNWPKIWIRCFSRDAGPRLRGAFSASASSAQGSVNVSSGRINNEYRAVIDQSGVFAGKGGFDIFVGNHTQLDGAVIASDVEAAKNRLSTDTLARTGQPVCIKGISCGTGWGRLRRGHRRHERDGERG